MTGRGFMWLILPAALGCSKGASDAPPAAASAGITPSASVVLAVSAAPLASARAAEASRWSGSYASKIGSVDPPKAAKEKAWTEDPGSAAVGSGTLELSITDPRGETLGEAKGPLGDLAIVGTFDNDELRANLFPKAPKSPDAMSGFMLLQAAGPSTMTGTLRVSNHDARLVREASVSLTRK